MATSVDKSQARDLEADLALCEAATPGDWSRCLSTMPRSLCDGSYHYCATSNSEALAVAFTGPYGDKQSRIDADFIAAAREGWPAAIRRAMTAEAELDQIREELRQMYDHLNQARQCRDS